MRHRGSRNRCQQRVRACTCVDARESFDFIAPSPLPDSRRYSSVRADWAGFSVEAFELAPFDPQNIQALRAREAERETTRKAARRSLRKVPLGVCVWCAFESGCVPESVSGCAGCVLVRACVCRSVSGCVCRCVPVSVSGCAGVCQCVCVAFSTR